MSQMKASYPEPRELCPRSATTKKEEQCLESLKTQALQKEIIVYFSFRTQFGFWKRIWGDLQQAWTSTILMDFHSQAPSSH